MRHEDHTFWPSFVDLMTSLFVVALVLFVVSYTALSNERDRLRIQASDYKRIQDIEAAIKGLADGKTFEYQPEFKRYVFRHQVQFERQRAEISPSDYPFLKQAGYALVTLVKKLKDDPAKRDVRYLIVIEGMASNDNYEDNFPLSYQRALALYRFWNAHGIVFDPQICEVMISGSGTSGVGRFIGTNEYKNQRFLIQVIPKVAFQN